MQQLIYTSAPRLLESGKTGFGTVSCSRGMPKPLISYLERISTFDREAGVSRLDYYSCFRMGTARFHVFTRVSDAGADYTGRTNHLAQHFVIEEGTVEYTLMMPSTPAGVLAALDSRFIATWNGQPGYLDGEQMAPAVPSNAFYAWQACTGQADNARWLAASYYLNSCCLSADISPRTALELLHDGLLHRDDHGWGMGLSTAVVSNLSSSAFPITFLSGEQRAVGVRGGAGAHLLSATPALQPPTEADMPAVPAPMVSVTAPPAEAVAPAEAAAPAVPLNKVLPSPVPAAVPIPDVEPQDLPPHARGRREKRKSDNQIVLYVAGGCVAALCLAAWNMTGTKTPSKEVSPPAQVPQSPMPAEQEKKQEMPKKSPKLILPEKSVDKEPLKDITLPEKNSSETQIKPQPEKNGLKWEDFPHLRESETQVPGENKAETSQKTVDPSSQTAEEAPRNSFESKEDSEQAINTTDKQTSPQIYQITDYSVTDIIVSVVTERESIDTTNNQEILACLRGKKEIIEVVVTICFEGVNDKVQECLGGDINCSHIEEKVERADFSERIKNSYKEYAAKKKSKNGQARHYKEREKAFTNNSKLKKDYPEVVKVLEVADFQKAKELLKSNKKLSEDLQTLQTLYHDFKKAENDVEKAEKNMEAAVNHVFALKETAKLKFAATQQADDFIEITTEFIEVAPEK